MGRLIRKSKSNDIHKRAAPTEKPPTRIKVKLDVLGSLGLRPEKVTDFYFESKQNNELFTRPPCADSPGKTVELLALFNDRENTEMFQLQKDLLEREKRQHAINRGRIDELYELQNQLRERFIEANTFFKDCDERRTFAENKVAEEKQTHIKLKNAISEYKEKIEVLSEFREELKKTLDNFEPYEAVINDVVASSGNYWVTVKEVMGGCDALMLARVEIEEMIKQKNQAIEELRVQMLKITNEALLEVLGLKNELSELDRTYSEVVSECLMLEKMIGSLKDQILENTRTRWNTLNEISNLYKVLCRRKGISSRYKKTDIEKQLNFIKTEIGILRNVIKECKKTKSKTSLS